MTKRAGAVDRAAGHRVAGRLLDRDRLAGDHRFVDRASCPRRRRRRPAPSRRAARAGDRRRARRSSGTSCSAPSASTRRAVFGARPSSALIARARAAARAQLQHLAEQHEHDDHRRRLEVDGDLTPCIAERRAGTGPGASVADDAVAVRRADAERDQREHVQVPVHDRRPAALEERPAAPEHDRRRQRELRATSAPPAAAACCSGWPGSSSETMNGEHRRRQRASDSAKRRVMSSSSGLPCSSRLTVTGSSAMPQIGQAPGPSGAPPDASGRCSSRRVGAGWRGRAACAGAEERLRVAAKPLEAARAAEVVGLPAVVDVPGRVGRVDRHPADGIEDLGSLHVLLRVGVELRLAALRAEVIGFARGTRWFPPPWPGPRPCRIRDSSSRPPVITTHGVGSHCPCSRAGRTNGPGSRNRPPARR